MIKAVLFHNTFICLRRKFKTCVFFFVFIVSLRVSRHAGDALRS
nr:MAG TPA: hypothetical protein [Bacteriophage sp.]